MSRISIGTWAYCVGPYMNNPVPFGDVVKELKRLKFDGLELGAFFSHPNPENHPTKESRKTLKDLVESNGLEFSGIATDMWDYPGHPSHLADATDDGAAYLAMARKNLEFTRDLGITLFRVDTVQPPDILGTAEKPATIDKARAMDNVVKAWQHVCAMAGDMGINVTWEFEPGFVFNRPSDIVTVVNAVGAKNFGAMYDTCHAYMCSVVGSRHTGGPKETPGMVDLAQKLRGKINAIQIIDCDGKLNEHGTSTHKVFGTALIDFPPVMKELQNSGCPHDWWTIDLCFEDGAWPKTVACKKGADKLNAKFGSKAKKKAAPSKKAPAKKKKGKR